MIKFDNSLEILMNKIRHVYIMMYKTLTVVDQENENRESRVVHIYLCLYPAYPLRR